MTARRGGRPLVPAYLSTGGQARPSTGNLERLSVLTGLVRPETVTGAPGWVPGPPSGPPSAGPADPGNGVPLPPSA
ncbi:hypothetical protein ACFXG1_21180, partial [Streptomyces sp. NPDC059248]